MMNLRPDVRGVMSVIEHAAKDLGPLSREELRDLLLDNFPWIRDPAHAEAVLAEVEMDTLLSKQSWEERMEDRGWEDGRDPDEGEL